MQAGIPKEIKYETDAEPLTFESPKYKNTDKDLFVFETIEKDGEKYISVSVNPEIAANSDENEFDSYFYICAANLRKKIEVTPVRLDPFLNVDPTEIEIDIREYIASGDYSASIPIKFSTNLSNVTISGFMEDDNAFTPDANSLKLDGALTYNVATGTNELKVGDINGGKFWETERTLTLTYTATGNGVTRSKVVKIHIVPNQLNYIIHFRPNNWSNTHIYVYQCLELPSDHSEYPSKPVGYKDGAYLYSALEYSFTGKIAFLGWNKTKDDPNNSEASGSLDYGDNKGFFIFSNDTWTDGHSSWDIINNKNGAKIHYNDEYDFCLTYRMSSSNICGKCKDDSYNRGWPGIMMEKESDGWWKFVLTGVATPGKALIMFNNGHSGGDRFPGDAEPGLPLFDFPNREGWLDYAGGSKQFVSKKPQTDQIPPRTLRLYWPDNKYSGMNIWVIGGNKIIDSNNSNDFKREGNYLYYEFELQYDINTKIGIEGRTSDGKYKDKDEGKPIDEFTFDAATGTYCFTRDGNGTNGHSGRP